MKILIIATPRSGGTSLTSGIGEQNYYPIHEPFNVPLHSKHTPGKHFDCLYCNSINTNEWHTKVNQYPIEVMNNNTNIVLRTLSLQKPKNIKYQISDFQQKFITEFDTVILLDRRSEIEHKESYLNLIWRMETNKSIKARWNSSSIPDKYREEFDFDKKYTKLEDFKKQLKLISDTIKVPITYYEDLFGEDRMKSFETINKLDIDIDPFDLNDYLHPKGRYRQSENTPTFF